MLIDRPQISEGSSIINTAVANGAVFPSDPNVGELFYLTAGQVGLYVYSGNVWVLKADNADLLTHIADDTKHLTPTQNTLIDGITVTSADINSIPSLATSQNTTATNLSNHINDLTKHLTASQNTLLDGLAATLTFDELNYVDGVTSPIQTQFNSIVAINTQQTTDITNLQNTSTATTTGLRTDLNNHIVDDSRHITTSQNTLLDGISVGFNDINKLSGLASFLGTSALASYLANQDTAKLSIDGSNSMTGILNMGSSRITNVATPTAANDAVNKTYVDNMSQGIRWASACRVATTANISTLSGLQTIDTVAVSIGDRVLVKDQTDKTLNGIWLAASGAWSRATDYDAPSEVNGSAVFVVEGTAWPKSTWVQTLTTTSIGAGPGASQLNFSLFSGINELIGGAGIIISGTKTIIADVHPSGGVMLTMDNSTSSANPDSLIALTNVGTAGTYKSITVDVKGRVTAGTNPTTLAGYGITDATTPAQLADKVSKSGDTMTDPLIIGLATGSSLSQALPSRGSLGLNSDSNTAPASVNGYRNGVIQWRLDMPNALASADFYIHRFSGGTYQDSPFTIDRVTGVINAGLGINTTVLNAATSVYAPYIACYASNSTGRVNLHAGNSTNSGYIDFISAANIRQGYIGSTLSTSATQDAGSIPYVAATHAFSGNMTVSGSITANGDITAFSDARLKNDVKTIENALEKVNQLRGVTYQKDGKAGLGVIAQEVQKVVPSVVQKNDEYLSVAYGNMVGLLIEAVKELTARVKELESK